MTWDASKPEEILVEIIEHGKSVRYIESSLMLLGDEKQLEPGIAFRLRVRSVMDGKTEGEELILLLPPDQAEALADVMLEHLAHMPAADAIQRRN